MLMVPGLALFYGGMVRRKNVLATMMQSMVAPGHRRRLLGGRRLRAGVRRPACIDSPAREASSAFETELIFLARRRPDDLLPGTNIPIYLHCCIRACSPSSRRR